MGIYPSFMLLTLTGFLYAHYLPRDRYAQKGHCLETPLAESPSG